MLFIRDLHGGFPDYELLLRNLKAVDSSQHFFVYSLSQLIMTLPQYYYRAGSIRHQLINSTDTCKTRFCTRSAGCQYNVLVRPVIKYLLIFRNDALRYPYLFLLCSHL